MDGITERCIVCGRFISDEQFINTGMLNGGNGWGPKHEKEARAKIRKMHATSAKPT